jgi:hypothetical protein
MFSNTGFKFATATAKDATGFSEKMRLDSSGNFILGKTTTSSGTAGIRFATQDPGYSEHTRTAGTVMYLNRLTSEGQMVSFAYANTSFGGIGVSGGNNLYISGTATDHAGLTFATQSVLPTTQGAINNNTVDLGQNGNAFKDLYLSGGVYLGGTGAANKLDDYEEGTWTPNWVIVPTGTITSSVGKYTKVGDLVTLFLTVAGSAIGITNYARISNLPFAAVATYQGTGTYIIGGIAQRDHGWSTLAVGTSQWYFSSTPATSSSIVASITYTV